MKELKGRMESTEAIEREDALLKVESDIELTQEVQSNNAINAIFFRDGIAQGFNISQPSISQTQGFQSYLGDKVSLGSITEGSKNSYLRKLISNFLGCFSGDNSSRSASIQGKIQQNTVAIFSLARENKEGGIGVES